MVRESACSLTLHVVHRPGEQPTGGQLAEEKERLMELCDPKGTGAISHENFHAYYREYAHQFFQARLTTRMMEMGWCTALCDVVGHGDGC